MKSKNKKAIGLFLSFAMVLCVAVPGTLAAEGDTDTTTDSFLIGGEVTQDTDILSDDEPETPAHIEDCSDECTVEGCACPCHAEEPQKLAEPETPAAPEAPAHIETCVEGCNGENCPCSCHAPSLFDRIMACNTLEEIWAIVDNTPEELFLAMTEDQINQIEAKIVELEPEPLPAVVIEESNDEPVSSEIVYVTVNFDDVAPFGAPVVG